MSKNPINKSGKELADNIGQDNTIFLNIIKQNPFEEPKVEKRKD